MACPFLPEHQKVKPELYHITRQATIEPNNVDGWKWRTQPIKKRSIEAGPYLVDRLLNVGI